MKKLDYLQFYYEGDYDEESIEIPNDALVFKVSNFHNSHKFIDIWSYNILILSKESIKDLDNVCLGEYYLAMLDSVLSDYNFNDISEFPKIEFYIVECNFKKVNIYLPNEMITKESIYRISKFKGIDNDYIYFSYVTIKNPITMQDTYLLEYDYYDINTLFSYSTKITCDEKYKKLYEEFCDKIINKIK